jgi:hypothetical protein
MLSRAQEGRVREVLGSHPSGTIRTCCLEHLATAAKIPAGHAADFAAFVRTLRKHGDCQTRSGGVCGAEGHETQQLLARGPPTGLGPRGLSRIGGRIACSSGSCKDCEASELAVLGGWLGQRVSLPNRDRLGKHTSSL